MSTYSSFVLLNQGHVESPRRCRMLTLTSWHSIIPAQTESRLSADMQGQEV